MLSVCKPKPCKTVVCVHLMQRISLQTLTTVVSLQCLSHSSLYARVA